MSFRTKFILILLSASLTLYSVLGGWISTSAQQPANDPNAQLRIFESVLQHIQNDYVDEPDRKSTRLNSSHSQISYAVFCLKKKKKKHQNNKNNSHKKH